MKKDLLYFRVEDDAMAGDRIVRGDLTIIRIRDEVCAGKISLIIVGDEILLRRFIQHEKRYILEPSNPDYEIVIVDDIHVLGTIVMNKLRY